MYKDEIRSMQKGLARVRDKNRAKYLHLLLPVLSFSIILLVWEIIEIYSGWNEQVFPGLPAVASGMWQLLSDGTLIKHTVASLYRVSMGFSFSIVFGIPLGMLLGRWKFAKMTISPVIQFLRPISPLAWIPLAMLWFGIGDNPAIFLIFLSSFFPLTVSTAIAVSSINPIYFQVAANFNFNRWEVITKIIIPAILPSVFTALRITMGIAWVVVVAAEMIAVKSGLGYLIIDSRNALRMDFVVDGMIVIGVIGLLLDVAMRRLSRVREISWHYADLDS